MSENSQFEDENNENFEEEEEKEKQDNNYNEEKDDKNSYNEENNIEDKELKEEQIKIEINKNTENKKDAIVQIEEQEENNEEDNNKVTDNEDIDGKENNVFEDKKEEKEKEEEKIAPEIKNLNDHLKKSYEKTKTLLEQLRDSINTLQKEIQNNNNKRENYIKKLNDLNKKIKNEKDLKKTITEDMQNLDDIITNKIQKINEFHKMKKGRNSVERSKKELFLYKSSEDLINIKQKQLKNVTKLNTILDKDISKINSNLRKGYYINQGIQEENPEIKTKSDELNYIYNKLTTEISMIKNDIQILKSIKDAHNKCDNNINKLNKELEALKERKERNWFYSEIKAKNKEMNEIKRKQIVANKALDNSKFKYLLNLNNRYQYGYSKNTDNKLNKVKNKLFLSAGKRTNVNKNKSYIENELTNEENIDNNNYDTDNRNSVSIGDKYKSLLQNKINEKNRNQRKIYLEIKELNKDKERKEAELNAKEIKKFNLQKSNYNLENTRKLNENKIKKLQKQLNELKLSEENYDKQIIQKDLALEDLKKIVDSVNNMQRLRV